MIEQLGLEPFRIARLHHERGHRDRPGLWRVRLTIQGRDCSIDVTELPDDCPVLIGQIPLELLDFVVDMPGQTRLIGNPAHRRD